jgi:N-acetylglucosamine kinase-like BadF-type ATPase
MTGIIGIDAGGSKTRVLHASVADTISRIKIIKKAYFDSYNYRQDGISGLNRIVKQILARFLVDDKKDILLLGGFSGAGTPKSHRDIQRTFEKHGFRRDLINIRSDADLLLMAIGNFGIVLTAGTGSMCIGRRKMSGDGREINVRAGGYGFRAYSEPGGYQLGMRAVDAAIRIEDGRGQEPTVLYAGIKDYFDVVRLEEIIPAIYPRAAKNSVVNRQIAGIAKLVLKAAHEGDRTAIHLVKELVYNFADHILAVYNKLGLESSLVGLHGGLFADPHGEELLIRPLTQHALLSKYDLRFITLGTRKGNTDPLIEAMRLGVRSFVDQF